MKLDRIDLKILDILQKDATLAVAVVGERVGLSQTPCWKRIQRLEAQGVIARRVALVNSEAVGLRLTAIVAVQFNQHSGDFIESFRGAVQDFPEILDCFRVAGEIDFILKVVVADMAAYDAFYNKLINTVPIKSVTSHFAMERVKSTTAVPLPGGSIPASEPV